MARAAAAQGDVAAETQARVGAVLAIEAMRSSQDRHQYQQEYQERFAMVYSAAVRAAVRNDDPAAFITVFENLAGRRLAGLLEKIPGATPPDGGDLAANMASAERRARLVERLSQRGGTPETTERALADVAAALYRSFSPLTRGSRAVLATTGELADDPAASRFLNGVLYRLPEAAMPAALHEMTRRFLADPRHRAGYLSRWAPLITVGTV